MASIPSDQAINQVTNNGYTALTFAAYKGLDKVCEVLIPKMSIQIIESVVKDGGLKGHTALSVAKDQGFKNIYELLQKTEKEYKEQQQFYNQKLISSIKENNIEEANYIISYIDPKYFNGVDKNNNTALHYAVDKNLEKLSISIISKMSSKTISICNIHNNTVLHYATDNGLEVVSWLLINKMTQKALDIANTDGNTALDYAIHNKLLITGLLAKKMSLEMVKTVNANCTAEYLEKINNYKTLEEYNKTREHEKVIGKCFPLPIKLRLSSLSLEEKNTSETEGLTPVLVGLGVLGLGAFFCYYFYNSYLKKNADQKPIVHIEKDKLDIFERIVVEVTAKLEKDNGIVANDKDIIQNSINEVTKTVKTFSNKDDINAMITSMEEFARGKITKARIAVVKEDLNEIIEQQIKLKEQIRTEKLTIFENAIAEMVTKIKNSTTINEKDKDIMQVSIREIVNKVERLDNRSDIEAITENVKELISSKITKARIAVVEEDVEQLIEQQNKLSQSIILNKVVETKELSQIDVNKEQTFNLIKKAMNNNDEELVLAGVTSLANDHTPPAG
ncbi:MAG: hypothetical protein LN566_03620 [Rickettsia endosymbiont of Stiretrus anchorago]|nr:hypothetical protein [Rickettsia endosymbiont of Stiretrus anchorago]